MTASLPIAVAAGLAAAGCFGIATAIQHVEAGRVARRGSLNPLLLGDLARRPLWVLSFVAEGLAVGLNATALRYGPVALVQVLVLAGLPVAVVLSLLVDSHRLEPRGAAGLVLCTLGIAVFALVTGPGGTLMAAVPEVGPALLTGAVGALVVAVLLHGVRFTRWRAAAAGAAAGVVLGGGSVLLAVCVASGDHPRQLLATWPPYALVAVGLFGLLLSQSAFQTGALGRPLAALSVVEPATAVVLAAVLLHQPLPAGPFDIAVACMAAVLATCGVVLLSNLDSLAEETSPEGSPRGGASHA